MKSLFPILLTLSLVGCGGPKQNFQKWTSPSALRLQKKIAADPKDADAYYWQGYAASHVGDVATVKASYEKAIQLDPERQWYRISYGWALFNAGAFADASRQWLSAYDFCKGQHRESLITVALGYYGIQDYEKAATFYDRQVKKDERYGSFEGLQEATGSWTWREKTAIYDLFDIWRYSY